MFTYHPIAPEIRAAIIGLPRAGISKLLLAYLNKPFTFTYQYSGCYTDFTGKHQTIEGQSVFYKIFALSTHDWQTKSDFFKEDINQKANVCFACFDLTSQSSFDEMINYLRGITFIDPSKVILVGTKSDLVAERKICKDKIAAAMVELGLNSYISTNAKENRNIEEVFDAGLKLGYSCIKKPEPQLKESEFIGNINTISP